MKLDPSRILIQSFELANLIELQRGRAELEGDAHRHADEIQVPLLPLAPPSVEIRGSEEELWGCSGAGDLLRPVAGPRRAPACAG